MNCSEIAVSTISSVNFLTDVIVPLLSALIGGLMALLGVYITQKEIRTNMNKNRKKKLVHFSPSSTMVTNALHLMMFVFGDSFRQIWNRTRLLIVSMEST